MEAMSLETLKRTVELLKVEKLVYAADKVREERDILRLETEKSKLENKILILEKQRLEAAKRQQISNRS